MIISLSHNFIFIHNYKVAGNSIRKTIEPYARHTPVELMQLISNPHTRAYLLRKMITEELFNRQIKFGFMRNPWDWKVSLYHFYLQEKNHFRHEIAKSLKSFENYLEWVSDQPGKTHGPQNTFFKDQEGKLIVEFVGRFEKINEDFSFICKALNLSHIQLPHINKTVHKDYREYYSPRMVDIISALFKDDIAFMGYDFEDKTKYKEIPVKQPVVELMNQGFDLISKNALELAEEYFLAALLITPHNSLILTTLGDICSQQNNYNKAVEYYQKAIEYNPLAVNAWQKINSSLKK